jgi:SH3 domain protein
MGRACGRIAASHQLDGEIAAPEVRVAGKRQLFQVSMGRLVRGWPLSYSWQLSGNAQAYMIKQLSLRTACILLVFLAGPAALAESAWVSDQFEIMLRTGPSTNNAIQLMLGSGAKLEVLERDAESGYSRVRTSGGTEGWVLTRYLIGEPAAREQLEQLSGELTNATAQGSTMGSQLKAIKSEYDNATRRIAGLEAEKKALQTELDQIKKTAANVLAIDSQNQSFREQLGDAQTRITVLEQENEALGRQTNRNWFITGALVLLGGVAVGLLLPSMRFQRRSRYDRL